MMILPVQGLTEAENKALEANLRQLTEKRPRVVMRQNFYNTKKMLDKVGFSIPPSMAQLDAVLGWPTKAVDSLSGRIKLQGFVIPGTKGFNTDLEEIYNDNRMATEGPQTRTAALIAGCAFVAVTPGDVTKGEPEVLIQAMPASESTGIWDVRLRRLSSAMWLPDPEAMVNNRVILFTFDNTVMLDRDPGGDWRITRVKNKLPRLPVTPLVFHQQLGRPFGNSRISRAVIYLCQMAARSLLRTEVGAEFYSSPQRYAMGASAEDFIDEHGDTVSAWDTILGKTWLIGRDEEGNIPTVGQFPQATMQPHVEVMRLIATLYGAETSLPMSSLGIIHDNPASAAAIDAAWADMVQLAEQCHTEMGVAEVEIAQNALMTQRKLTELPKELKRLKAKYVNAATPTLAAQADAVSKMIGVGQLTPDSEVGLEQSGFDETDIARIKEEHAVAKAEQAKQLEAVGGALNGPTGNAGARPGQPVTGAKPRPAVGSGVPAPRPAPPGR